MRNRSLVAARRFRSLGVPLLAGFSLACAAMHTVAATRTPRAALHTAARVMALPAGTTSFALTAEEVAALANGNGAELMRQLTVVSQRLAAGARGAVKQEPPSLAALHGLIAAMREHKLAPAAWSAALDERLRQYATLDRLLDAGGYAEPEVKIRVGRADIARRLGQFETADRLLEEAATMARQTAAAAGGIGEAQRQAARLLAGRAVLALLREEPGGAAALWERAFDLSRDDLSVDVFDWLLDAGDAWLAQGDEAAALRVYGSARSVATELAARTPDAVERQRNLSLVHDKIGDLLAGQDHAAAALQSYQASLAITERLAAASTRDTRLQHELAASLDAVADMQAALGDTAAAQAGYRAALAIRERLAAAEPGNLQALAELASDYFVLGDLQAAQGDSAAALASYRAGVAPRERLAARAGDGSARRELAAAYGRVGDAQAAQHDLPAALKSYQAALLLSQQMAAAAPREQVPQRELAVSLSKIGDIDMARSDPAAALPSYTAALAIQAQLAAGTVNTAKTGDGSDVAARRDLSISHNKVGDAYAARNDAAAALKHYQASLALRQALAAGDPANAQWQRDLAVAYWNVARVDAAGAGSLPVAARREAMRKGLDILLRQRDASQLPASSAPWIKLFEGGLRALP